MRDYSTTLFSCCSTGLSYSRFTASLFYTVRPAGRFYNRDDLMFSKSDITHSNPNHRSMIGMP